MVQKTIICFGKCITFISKYNKTFTANITENMTFTINIEKIAAKWLRKHNTETQKRFANKVRKLKNQPNLHGKPLRGELHGKWSLYFENRFRIIYTIDYGKQIVTIEAIKHKDDF